MGWQDRDYNAGREQMKAYLSNPASFLSFALPLVRTATLQIRLSFWFLLYALFEVINILFYRQSLLLIPITLAVLLAVVLVHELGHRVFARMVGGNHWEWVVWPLGGMVAPTCPRQPWPTFVANVGGIVFSLLFAGAALGGLVALNAAPVLTFVGVFGSAFGFPEAGANALQLAAFALSKSMALSIFLAVFNLFPAFIFDGGYIWQSIFWPKFGFAKSLSIACVAGMVLSVPMFFLALIGTNLMGMIFWALVFSDCFRRRQLAREMAFAEMDDDRPQYDYMGTGDVKPRKKHSKRWFASARKRALKDQAEQARIDAILAKVKEKGLHSLTWWEKRTLRKATERQRQQDLAERF